MCEPTTLAVVGIGLSLGSGYMQYKAGKKAERRAYDEKRKRIQYAAKKAEEIKQTASKQASKIRAQSIVFRGTQLAQQAASGALIGDGSTQSAIDATLDLAEQDALIAIYDGEAQANTIIEQAKLDGVAMDARAASYKAQGQASLLTSFAIASYQGYNFFSKPKTPTPSLTGTIGDYTPTG